MIINRRQNEHKAMMHEARGGSTVYIDWSDEDIKGTTCQPQSMIVWDGMELIGCPRGVGNDRHGIVQGVVYHVTSIEGTHVSLVMNAEYQNSTDEDEDDEDAPDADVAKAPSHIQLPMADVPKLLRLTHAMCYFTVQGRTLRDKKLLLVDTEHPAFSRRALIVGLSRATHGNHVHVANADVEESITGCKRRHVTII